MIWMSLMKNNLKKILQEKSCGRIATKTEVSLLLSKINFLPNWFCDFIMEFPVLGMNLELNTEDDLSNIGVDFIWLSPQDMITELFDMYPGINVIKKGFLPIGACGEGSGDYYYIDTNCHNSRVIRVIHDEYDENENNIVDVIQSSFENFLLLSLKNI